MALTRLLFPLALFSLLIIVASTGNVDQLGSNLDLDNIVDQLLGNQNDNKQDNDEHNKPHKQETFVPRNPISYEETKPYEGQEHIVSTKPYYGQEQKTYDQAHEGIYPDINTVAIQGFVLCESEANKYYPLEGAMVGIICLSSYENGYNEVPYMLHAKTDEKGCFREIVAVAELKNKYINLKECKAYPKYSPSKTWNVPAYGSTGAQLSLLRNEEGKPYYTAGNIVYTPNTHYESPTNYPASNNLPVQNGY